MTAAKISCRRKTLMVPKPSFEDFLNELSQDRTAHANPEQQSTFISRGRPPLSQASTSANSANLVLLGMFSSLVSTHIFFYYNESVQHIKPSCLTRLTIGFKKKLSEF